MRIYTDWNCRLLPMMGDLISNTDDSMHSLLLLKEKFGLKQFCMMPEFNREHDSVAAFLIRRDKAFSELSKILPNDFNIMLGASVPIYPEMVQEIGLNKLLLPKSNLLPVRLPFFTNNEIAKAFNQLLYHSSFKLLLMSFDSYWDLYPKEDIKRWCTLPNVAFQLNYSVFAHPMAEEFLNLLLQRNATVLFGTGINSYGKACYYEFDHYIDLSKRFFNDHQRDILFFPKKNSLR